MEILLIEDNSRISEFVKKGLEEHGFLVSLAENGSEGRDLIVKKSWDIILLDIMLPEIDGIELLQYIRYKKISVPVLVISALNDPDDKVKALDYGADDYLAKPFHFKELVARINALSRRSKQQIETTEILQCGSLKLHTNEHKVERKGKEIKLTSQEFKLLRLLIENKGKVLSRAVILDKVWNIHYDNNTNVVDVYISYLRNKIDADYPDKLIETVKGRGYMIHADD